MIRSRNRMHAHLRHECSACTYRRQLYATPFFRTPPVRLKARPASWCLPLFAADAAQVFMSSLSCADTEEMRGKEKPVGVGIPKSSPACYSVQVLALFCRDRGSGVTSLPCRFCAGGPLRHSPTWHILPCQRSYF